MLDSDKIVSFSRDVLPVVELKSFWPPEDGFVWSAGRWCEIAFDYRLEAKGQQSQGELVIELDCFKAPPQLEAQSAFFYLNGLRVGARRVNKRATVFIEFDGALLKPANVLTIDTPDATSPSQFSGTDERVLGVQLFSLQVRYFVSGSL